jgi:hypothetical protein
VGSSTGDNRGRRGRSGDRAIESGKGVKKTRRFRRPLTKSSSTKKPWQKKQNDGPGLNDRPPRTQNAELSWKLPLKTISGLNNGSCGYSKKINSKLKPPSRAGTLGN